MITKKDAVKFWANYFEADEQEALDCHHMTIDCMVKFAQEQVKNCSIHDAVGQNEQLVCSCNVNMTNEYYKGKCIKCKKPIAK